MTPALTMLATLALAAAVVFLPARPAATAAVDVPATTATSRKHADDSDAALRAAGRTAECEPGSLPDGDVCVRLPDDEGTASDAPVLTNSHRERTGRWAVYDQIPRLPERPEAYEAYRYPIDARVVSGYDLDRPDTAQRRGRTLRATGHGGVDLPQAKGTKVSMVPLEHQRGDAEVVYVGALFGTTVVTRHAVAEAGELRDYLLLFGHLDGPAPGLGPGARLAEGALVGFVGDTGSPELVHLHLEARRMQPGVDAAKVPAARLLAPDVSVVCDPRNVLPLR